MTDTHAIAIARVSTLKQRQEDQRPGLVTYSERQGYVLDDIVEVHGRSAFHGKHKGLLLDLVIERWLVMSVFRCLPGSDGTETEPVRATLARLRHPPGRRLRRGVVRGR